MAISRMIDRVGQVLGGRYRLVAPIGTGASASVYLADDVTLRRRVAVKILHDALADDAAFLRRFRAEAQAAAALNHPHIMAVYDWGHGDVPYLVTEYLGGGSLRALLDLGNHLSLSQALLVGLEASRGLEYAQRRGFVHRDIKPANLLFDEDARLRIADFGLARALAEAAWTEPAGAVMGTARYASPEQARGETLDAKSDVYSLALVIIESVTGEVPFSTDTTIGTLMARVEQPVTVPDALGPLKHALERAGVPDPVRRPDATEFGALLMGAAATLDRPEPLPLAGAMAHDPAALDSDPTAIYLPERQAVADFEPDIMSAPPGTTTDGITILHEGEGQPETRRVDRSGAADKPTRAERKAAKPTRAERKATEARAAAEADAARVDIDDERRRRRWPKVLLALLLVAGLAGGGYAYWWYAVRVPVFAVPELVGQNESDLASLTSGTDWQIERTETRADGTVAGQILNQDPAPGTELAKGAALVITVSLGPPLVDVPTDLVNKSFADATAELQALGLTVADPIRQFTEDVPFDVVMGPVPGSPGQMPKGEAVALVVSDGPKPRQIPGDLVNQTADAAAAELKAVGLKVTTTSKPDETVPEGKVLEVNPGAGTEVPRDSTVTLVVSSGPPTVVVPSVKGLSAADAAAQLQEAGLVVSSTQGSPANKATGTTPAAGTTVRRGTSVVIITG